MPGTTWTLLVQRLNQYNHRILRTTPSGHWRLVLVGAALLLAGCLLILFNRAPTIDNVLDDACRTHVSLIKPVQRYFSETTLGGPAWFAVVIHGLAANRKVMIPIGQQLASSGAAVYLLDSPGEGDSTGKFSFANTESCAASAIAELARTSDIHLDRTVIVGHSLGGATAIRLADQFPQSAGTIALSPAPLIMPRHVPANLLIVSAQFDPWQLRNGVKQDLAAIGHFGALPSDFAAHRAVGYVYEPFALHGSVLFDPRVLRIMTAWALKSVQMPSDFEASTRGEMLAMSGGALGLVGLTLMLPFFATLCVRLTDSLHASAVISPHALAPLAGSAADVATASNGAAPLSLRALYVRLMLAAIAAAVLLIPGVPLRGLHLYSADYVASFLALAGLILLVLLPDSSRARIHFDRRAHFAAILFALIALFAFGFWLNWQMTSFLPNATRAWRILPLALVTWPFFAAEELALKAAVSPASRHAARDRWLLFLGSRGVLLGVLILGYFGFANSEFLPILIAPFMFVISCAQRWGSDLLRARTGSILAGAAFNAILAAWFFAAVFPLQ